MYRTRKKSGFTLVEILIVVIILGILAAIVIPQFTNASQDARKSNLASQCQTLKSQIELFKLQHKDQAPLLLGTDSWNLLIETTNDSGTLNPSATPTVPDPTNGYTFGPYMQAIPVNPLTNSNTVVVDTTAPDKTTGWLFNATTGAIHGVSVGSDGTTFYPSDDGVNKL